jgi:hypothetical protein
MQQRFHVFGSHANITKRRDTALARLRERRERSRARVHEAIGVLEQAVNAFDVAFAAELELTHHPRAFRPLQWGRFLPQIRVPSGEPLEFGAVTAALRHRFEGVPEPDGKSVSEPAVDVEALEAQFADEPEIEVGERPTRIGPNGIRI